MPWLVAAGCTLHRVYTPLLSDGSFENMATTWVIARTLVANPEFDRAIPVVERGAQFSDGTARALAFVAQLSLETDAILFDMRTAHDSVLSMAVNRQVAMSVRTRLFSDLAAQLTASMADAGFEVYQRPRNRAAMSSAAVTITTTTGEQIMMEPVDVEADMVPVVYPSDEGTTVNDLIASVPSRARGYELSGAIRTYLSGYREDNAALAGAAPAEPGDSAAGLAARPWESSADELQTTDKIVDDTARIAGIAWCGLRAEADVAKVWVVTEFVFKGFTIPPFIAGRENGHFRRVFPATGAGYSVPELILTCIPRGAELLWTLEVGDSDTPPYELRLTNPAQWHAFQVNAANPRAQAPQRTEWNVDGSIQFCAKKYNFEHLHENGGTVVNCTLDSVVLTDTGDDYDMVWAYEHGTVTGNRTVRCGVLLNDVAHRCGHFTSVEAAVPRLVRRAKLGTANARQQLRDELASAAPFTGTLQTMHGIGAYNTFLAAIKLQVRDKLSTAFELHACHNPTSGANSGRDDVPVIRMGFDGNWCTGQHALAATTGMLLASRDGCAL
jgi:hypothetical protein